MDYQISIASFVLSKYVKQYWAMENNFPKGVQHIQRIVPSGLSDLIFYFGDKPESTRKNNAIIENSVISGQNNSYYDLKVSGSLSLFSIIFQPFALPLFFDIPASELLNQNVPLRYILKDEVAKLEENLYEVNSFSQRIKIAEVFLLERLSKNQTRYSLNRIEKSIQLINQSKGLVSIEKLATEACYSRKQFERFFSEMIGISPKKFLRIVRFQHSIHTKSKFPLSNLTELSYECGYFDQSHMTNDFAKLSGMTPKQYFSDCEPYSDYFQ